MGVNVDKLLDYLLMHSITAGDILMNAILAAVGCAILYSLVRLHRTNGRWNNFNLVHLLVNKEGFPDGAKCIELSLFALMSWGFIVHVTSKTLPEWYLITYVGVFAARGGYGAYLRSKDGPLEQPGTIVETIVKAREVKPVEKESP